jgi:hypothetical protein
MAGIPYDYLMATVIVGTIFIAAVVAIPNVGYLNLLYLDQQQIRNVALEALKAMLLDAGYPSDWGTTSNFNQNALERFGLALSGSSSFQVLDPEKVQRLVVGNPSGYLEYETLRELLGLQDYGFNINIISPFNVTVNQDDNDLDDGELRFEVSVNFHDGRPIPNAYVEATIVYVEGQSGYFTATARNNTNSLGQCVIKKELSSSVTDYIVVLKATVADVTVITSTYMQGFQYQHTINTSIVDDNVTLSIPEGPGWESDSKGTRWVESVVVVSEDGIWNLYNGTTDDKITYGQGNWGWSKTFDGLSDYNPIFLIFELSVPNPRRLALFVGPYTTAHGYWVFNYGSTPALSPGGSVVKLSRSVVIGGMSYIFELLMWKES